MGQECSTMNETYLEKQLDLRRTRTMRTVLEYIFDLDYENRDMVIKTLLIEYRVFLNTQRETDGKGKIEK